MNIVFVAAAMVAAYVVSALTSVLLFRIIFNANRDVEVFLSIWGPFSSVMLLCWIAIAYVPGWVVNAAQRRYERRNED